MPWNKGLKGEEYRKHYKEGFKGLSKKVELAYDKNWLTEHYYGHDMSLADMAKILNCSKKTLQNGLIANDIPRKTNAFDMYQRDKKGRKKCPECDKWLDETNFHKDNRRADGLAWLCKSCISERGLLNKFTNKIIAFQVYSNGMMCCDECGIDDIDVLTIDHKNNNGTKHRKEINNNALSNWLIHNNFPEGYRVLCRNCNWKDRLKKEKEMEE